LVVLDGSIASHFDSLNKPLTVGRKRPLITSSVDGDHRSAHQYAYYEHDDQKLDQRETRSGTTILVYARHRQLTESA
jgi:hypothetical protein